MFPNKSEILVPSLAYCRTERLTTHCCLSPQVTLLQLQRPNISLNFAQCPFKDKRMNILALNFLKFSRWSTHTLKQRWSFESSLYSARTILPVTSLMLMTNLKDRFWQRQGRRKQHPCFHSCLGFLFLCIFSLGLSLMIEGKSDLKKRSEWSIKLDKQKINQNSIHEYF